MLDDMNFVDSFVQVQSWLGFALTGNPFVVPLELLGDEVRLSPRSFVIIGRRPQQEVAITVTSHKKKFLKSPYLTPIINDPEIFSHLSVKSQLNKQFKSAGKVGGNSQVANEDYEADPFETILSFDQIANAKKCWKMLMESAHPRLDSTSLTLSDTNSTSSPSLSTPNRLRQLTARSRLGQTATSSDSRPTSSTSPATQDYVDSFFKLKEDFHQSVKVSSG